MCLKSIRTMNRKAFYGALVFAALAFLLSPAHSQSWRPDKPIEIIAASGAGGNTDRLARTIQRIMQDEKLVLTPVNVVNKTGGNQTLARVYLNQHPGDAPLHGGQQPHARG